MRWLCEISRWICLRTFVTVAEMRGFTLAGQLLGRSQPAISLQIKRLEELIDAQVFIRGGQQTGTDPHR